MQTKLSRTEGLNSTSLDGFYLLASWFITGESRNYLPATGEFGRSVPDGGRGSLELALRYSSVDLNDEDSLMEAGEEDLVLGGEADQWTLGLNWRLNPYIRIMGNLSRVDHDEFADEDGDLDGDDDFSIFQLRFQLNF
jgi:phosphate-selective porin OprO/OprP